MRRLRKYRHRLRNYELSMKNRRGICADTIYRTSTLDQEKKRNLRFVQQYIHCSRVDIDHKNVNFWEYLLRFGIEEKQFIYHTNNYVVAILH